MPDDLGALLRSMLAWDPNDRLTAEKALADKVWEPIAVWSGSENEEYNSFIKQTSGLESAL
jgi:hypothetical protein